MRRVTRTSFCIATWLVACASLPANGIHLVPTAYAEWWAQVEQCSGKTYPMDSIRWAAVLPDLPDGFSSALGDSTMADANWGERRVRILTSHLFDAPVVRHEAAHMIASHGHHDPRIFQRGPCASLVVCYAECRADSLPPGR